MRITLIRTHIPENIKPKTKKKDTNCEAVAAIVVHFETLGKEFAPLLTPLCKALVKVGWAMLSCGLLVVSWALELVSN